MSFLLSVLVKQQRWNKRWTAKLNWLVGDADGSEDKDVAVDDDEKWQEEDKDEEQHGVRSHWRGEGHVVPRTGSQQALRHVRAWWDRNMDIQETKVNSFHNKSEKNTLEDRLNSLIYATGQRWSAGTTAARHGTSVSSRSLNNNRPLDQKLIMMVTLRLDKTKMMIS